MKIRFIERKKKKEKRKEKNKKVDNYTRKGVKGRKTKKKKKERKMSDQRQQQQQQQQQQAQQEQQQSKSWIGSLFGYLGSKLQSWFSVCPENPDLKLVMYDDDGQGDDIFIKDALMHDNIQKDDVSDYDDSSTSESSDKKSESKKEENANERDNNNNNDNDVSTECEKKKEVSAKKRVPKFLGRYTKEKILDLFENFIFNDGKNKDLNFNKLFEKLGFDPTQFLYKIDDSGFVHIINMYYMTPEPDSLVAQLSIQNTRRFDIEKSKLLNSLQTPAGAGTAWPPQLFRKGFAEGCEYFRGFHFSPRPSTSDASLDVVNIEWLRFQNPLKKGDALGFLPGQLKPSLGIVTEMHLLLERLCQENGRDGVINTPERFYNAFIYSKFKKWPYKFLNPAFEGFFQSIKMAISPLIESYGFQMLAWAMDVNTIKCAVVDSLEAANEFNPEASTASYVTVKWETQEQAYAMTPRFKKYFESPGYKKMVERYTLPRIFSVDMEALEKFLKYKIAN